MSPDKRIASIPYARDKSIDALRGIAIISVVLSHIVAVARVPGTEDGVRLAAHSFLYLFNVQLFAFVSGYVTSGIDLRKKAASLLIPLAAWVMLGAMLASPALIRDIEGQPVGLIGILNGDTRLWFLWALFTSFVVVAALRRWPSALAATALALGLAWRYVPVLSGFRAVGILLPYLVLGIAAGQGKLAEKLSPRAAAAALAAFIGVAWLTLRIVPTPLWVGSPMPPSPALTVPLRMVAATLACIALLGIAKRLAGYWLDWIASVGVLSLGVFGFHGLIMASFPSFFSASRLIMIPPLFALLLALSVALSFAVSRSAALSRLLLGGRTPTAAGQRTEP